jgi:copper chaperone CopZ
LLFRNFTNMENNKHINLEIEGMSCANCALSIKNQLENLGLEEVAIDYATGKASYVDNPAITLKEVITAINEIGAYKVVNQ